MQAAETVTRPKKRRRPVVAALLSLLVMGLGQLYSGQHRRALIYFAIFLALTFLPRDMLVSLALSFPGMVAGAIIVLSYIGLNLFAIADAYLIARRGKAIELRPYNRWYVYLAIVAIAYTSNILMENFSEGDRPPVWTYSIVAGSNLPGLAPGDLIVADTTIYLGNEPKRGDVIIFKLPTDNQTDYVKRLIGLPGERIQIRDGILRIDGVPVERRFVAEQQQAFDRGHRTYLEYEETLPDGRSYSIWEKDDRGILDNTPEYLVPPNHYFFMGDNRDQSQDSRILSAVGYVPRQNIVGRALYVYWGGDLSRIGKIIQ